MFLLFILKVGCHVSIAGSIDNSVDNAVSKNCSAFQIFTRSPRSWNAKELNNNNIKKFKQKLLSSTIDEFSTIVHMPYLPNLASPNSIIYEKSIYALKQEASRCAKLGIHYLVAHLGSHMDSGETKGIRRLVDALKNVNEKDVTVLLENSSGQKNSLGYDFKQLASIFNQLNKQKFGICIDTCHVFASGYDIRNNHGIQKMFEEFDQYIGIENFKLLHLNDSKNKLNSNIDRHYHIGLGQIGEFGLSNIIKFVNKLKVPIILETPIDSIRNDLDNIKKTKELAYRD